MVAMGRLVIPRILVSIVAGKLPSAVSDAGASGRGMRSPFNRSCLGIDYPKCRNSRPELGT